MLINGKSGNLISVRDRGLLYGDGVFRTLLVRRGKPQHWPLHFQKLWHDCAALNISCPDFNLLTLELESLAAVHPDAVFKIIVTRGLSARGYAPDPHAQPNHVWDASALPVYPDDGKTLGVKLSLCKLRLGHQPRLAGIKHLNRLENVLAASEIGDAAEGLMLDVGGHAIEGTRSNLFLVSKGVLVTPDLSRCGVAGVTRDRVMSYAKAMGMTVEVRDVLHEELLFADELFLTGSVFGVWPVARFDKRCWTDFNHVAKIAAWLDEADHG